MWRVLTGPLDCGPHAGRGPRESSLKLTARRNACSVSCDASRDLIGVWRHSCEEDTGAECVYRPEDYDFPPARGRTGYEFRANRTCDFLGISPRDGTARTGGRWELDEDPAPAIVMTFPGGRREVLLLVSLDNSRLVVRKTAGA